MEVVGDFSVLSDLKQLIARKRARTVEWELTPSQVATHHSANQIGFWSDNLEVGLSSPYEATFREAVHVRSIHFDHRLGVEVRNEDTSVKLRSIHGGCGDLDN